MKTKHTPGPWKVLQSRHRNYPELVIEGPGSYVCTIEETGGKSDIAQAAADASLICAAPEMLEALQELYNRYGIPHAAMNAKIKELINKATKGK